MAYSSVPVIIGSCDAKGTANMGCGAVPLRSIADAAAPCFLSLATPTNDVEGESRRRHLRVVSVLSVGVVCGTYAGGSGAPFVVPLTHAVAL